MKRHETLKINIPEPCQQSWEEMAPDGYGRFCASCRKTVIDFTVMTDAEIINIFRKSEIPPCGRFLPEQLNRSLQEPGKVKSFPFYQKIAAAIITIQAFTIHSFAQGKKKPLTAHYKKTVKGEKLQVVKGRVLSSETDQPMPKLQLLVMAAGMDSFTTTTNAAGYFQFTLPDSVRRINLWAGDITTKFAVNETIALAARPTNLHIYSYPKHLLPDAAVSAFPLEVRTTYVLGGSSGGYDIEPLVKRLVIKRTLWYRITHTFSKKHH